MIESLVTPLGEVTFPRFSSLRIMMMPFRLDNPNTVPLDWARPVFDQLLATGLIGLRETGYLTIDEALVRAGEHHRRPGLHVDGAGAWGGGGGGWGSNGFVVAASHVGSRAWNGTFDIEPDAEGCLEHVRSGFFESCATDLAAGVAYLMSPMAVHESITMKEDTLRQFMRISFPNDAPWFEGYTPSPFGVRPTGPVLPRRERQMAWRPS